MQHPVALNGTWEEVGSSEWASLYKHYTMNILTTEALKLYHMKLTLAYSSLLALHASDSLPEYKKWEMIIAKKVLNPQMGVTVWLAAERYVDLQQLSAALQLFSHSCSYQ